MFGNRSLNFKVFAVLIVALLGAAVIAGTGIYTVTQLISVLSTQAIAGERSIQALKLSTMINLIRNDQKVAVMEDQPDQIKDRIKIVDRLISAFRQDVEKLRIIATEADKKKVDDILVNFDIWLKGDQEVRKFAIENKDKEAVAIIIGSNRHTMAKALAIVKEISDQDQKIMAEVGGDVAGVATLARTSITLVLVIAVAAILLSLTLGYFVMRSVNRAVQRLVQDLDQASSQTLGAAEQVSGASQQLAQGSNEQAASLEETSSTLEEISRMTKQNAENTRKAESLAEEAQSVAIEGTKAMQRMHERIGAIKESSDTTARIIKTIDEIAFQTNLLALNAAVEAARAGDAGRGFAVVAEEVRTLAQRSAQAAKETAALIEASQNRANEGVEASTKVSENLGAITHGVQSLNTIVQDVAQANRQQAAGVEQINGAVQQMEQVTQSNAANAEETAASAEELSSQAQSLRGSVKGLVSVVFGGGTNGSLRLGNGGGAVKQLRQATTAPTRYAPARSGGLRAKIERSQQAQAGGMPKQMRAAAGHEFKYIKE